ncbi:hypothetical protein KIN20_013785 [Parelaphostrongylus tenuis]|uniref:Uncharacterized protein n=1 Tax=Parelaphostrongylus tenuis TaxID=148309 RepID=A0AAD5MCL5_PARTN|nr:hypothetical protein KIN20_013785 [Parelaphostrongylus tenuis]
MKWFIAANPGLAKRRNFIITTPRGANARGEDESRNTAKALKLNRQFFSIIWKL